MIYFLIISIIYIGLLVLIKPSPDSLKATPITFTQNFKNIKASLFVGLLILLIFLFTSKFNYISTDETIFKILALNNVWEMSNLWPIQTITHLFIHSDLLHIVTNVTCLGVASVYERRVGSKRFLTILAISSIFSIPSVFFYPKATAVCGISGGIFGLAAGYFTDFENLTKKEWFFAILIFILLIVLVSIESELNLKVKNNLNIHVDHIGHALGAIGAIIFCRLKSANSQK